MSDKMRALLGLALFLVGGSLGACKRSMEYESCQASGDCAGQLRCIEGMCLQRFDPDRICPSLLQWKLELGAELDEAEFERDCRARLDPSRHELYEYQGLRCVSECISLECYLGCGRETAF